MAARPTRRSSMVRAISPVEDIICAPIARSGEEAL